MITKFPMTRCALVLAGSLLFSAGLPTGAPAQPAGNPPPKILECSPKNGASNVDPATLTEITITFDQDMQEGMSWTGGGPDFPGSREGRKAHWTDKRTCVLPVKIEPGHRYRVGINSPSYQNFRSATGVPVPPTAISFTTKGSPAGLPRIVTTSPTNGATGVDAVAVKEITVTFDQDMDTGMSWTGSGPEFPPLREGEKARWKDKRTCVLPVTLESGHRYRVGINSPSYRNFRSVAGASASPTAILFTTK